MNAISFRQKCYKCKQSTNALVNINYSITLSHDNRDYNINIDKLAAIQCASCFNVVLPDSSMDIIYDDLRRQTGLLMPEEIKQHREALGYTTKQLGDMFDVGQGTVERWESGGQFHLRTMDAYLRAFFAVPELRKYLEKLHGIQL